MTHHKLGAMSRRKFVRAAAAGTLLAVGGTSLLSAVAAKPRRPNVLFILTDDLGWGDLSIYGQQNYRTPNLDRLAKEGTRFINAYAAQTVCTPTRVAFLTGRYPARLAIGLQEPLKCVHQADESVGLPPEHPTIASLLKANGYETALVGKWHCGPLPKYSPLKSGFDEYFGNLNGGIDYFTHKDSNGRLDLYEGEVPVERSGYATDLYTQRAIEFIKRPRNRPFYLSLQYNAPHRPWEGPNDEELSRTLYSSGNFGAGGSPQTYAAMIESLDDGVGRVLRALQESGQADNTIVIFTSDNGGEQYPNFAPFQGSKYSLYEGGLRVPACIRWPGAIAPNQVSRQVIITTDLTATILAATETQPDPKYPLDGENLLPLLRSRRPVYPRTLFWRYQSNCIGRPPGVLQTAVRSGKWKYLSVGENEYLFDLSKDMGENINLKDQYPDVLKLLRTQFQAWNSQVLPYPT